VRWSVCYTDAPSPYELGAYDVVVLDPDGHPPLAPLIERRRTVLAYLSLGEAGRGRRFFPSLQAAGVVLDAHPVWTDAHYLDLRRPEWMRTVIEDIAPRALQAGFSGFFLDTLDDAEYLETLEPKTYRGMRRAAVELVLAIRHHYPDAVLMVNRGYALMPQIAGSIDILLGESVLSTFDSTTKTYRRTSPGDANWQISAMRQARAINPTLRLFTLDYWDPADPDGIRRLYREQRANGFVPYVSTPALDSLIGEPQ
jgi:uncharacterized protein (TIGR01370 family)